MVFDLATLLKDRRGDAFELHTSHMNHQLAGVLETLGFDRSYVSGSGCYLYDTEGNRYLDLLSGFGVHALGRNHPAVTQALHEALALDLPNMVQIDCALLPALLAERLLPYAHRGINRVFFCNSGTEAVEAAIKFARCATKRPRILYCSHAFHGLTTGSLALNGGAEFRRGFGRLLPDTTEVPFGDADALRRELRHRDVAAFVFEPIQGKGVYVAPDSYWDAVATLCRQFKTLMVADEVQTGLGRTGRFFCHQHWGLEPDIITVSKALSGGLVPVGATLCTDRVFKKVFSSLDRAMVHSSTFGRNQLAMVAGLATLSVLETEQLVEHAAAAGATLMEKLQVLVDRYEVFHEVRGKGLMIGLVFGKPQSPSLRRRWRATERLRAGLSTQAIVVPLFHRHRILTQVAADNVNIIKLLPPLIAGIEEINAFVEALDDVLGDLERSPRSLLEVGGRLARGALRTRLGALRRAIRPPRTDRPDAATTRGFLGPRHEGTAIERAGRSSDRLAASEGATGRFADEPAERQPDPRPPHQPSIDRSAISPEARPAAAP